MPYENIDKYGHCVCCHRNLIIERVVDGKAVKMFLPDKEETEFLLDDGSRMRVCICRDCKKTRDFTDKKLQDSIMEAVINGWELEVKGLVEDENRKEWTPERGKNHMDIYKQKKIVLHSEFSEKHIIDDSIKDIIKNKIGIKTLEESKK